MAVFSRRAIHRMMRENARFLSDAQVKGFLQKLNKADERSLHFEWEIALLNVFSKIGRVEHEKKFGVKNPDIYLSSYGDLQRDLIADITTVSDTGLGPEGLVEAFDKRLRIEAGKRRLQFDHFSKDFKRIAEGAKLEDFFNTGLEQFLDKIALDPRTPGGYESTDGAFTMRYDPQQKSYTRSSPITSKRRLTNNPFYNALKSKLDQLKEADYNGPRGIILCDGGSDMFFFKKTDVLQYGSDDIVKDFLRRNSSINFVLTVWVDRNPDPSQPLRLYKVQTQLFPNRNFDEVPQDIRQALVGVERLFPLAVVPVSTALSHIQQGLGKEGWSLHYGKVVMSEDKKQIKIPARALLALLAGELKQDHFLEDHKLELEDVGVQKHRNPFMQHLRAGELINDISLERSELDDDYVVISFGYDPAVSSYDISSEDK